MKRSSGFGLTELVAAGEGDDVVVTVGAGEAVVVAVGAGEGEDGVVVITGVVVCCALTMGGASHEARSTNPAAKIARTTMDNFNKARVRSVISPPAIARSTTTLAMTTIAPLPAFRHKRPRTTHTAVDFRVAHPASPVQR